MRPQLLKLSIKSLCTILMLFLVFLACAWIILIFIRSTSLVSCVHLHKSFKEYSQLYNQPALREIVTRLNLNAICVAQSFNDFNGSITAISGTAVAVFTMALWRSTNQLWKAGEKQLVIAQLAANAALQSAKTAERALHELERALVYPKGIRSFSHVGEDEAVWWSFHASWENSGRSRAQNLRIWSATYMESVPLPEDFPFINDIKDAPFSSLAPGATTDGIPVAINGFDLKDVQVQTKYFYIWGEVLYDDIFGGKDHTSKFCYKVFLLGNPTQPFNTQDNYVEFSYLNFHKHNTVE